MTNFVELIKNLVGPLIVYPEDLKIESQEDDQYEVFKVYVRKEDLGRVIGKSGKIAQAIRTIIYAGASKDSKKVKIDFESL